jgi:putative sterol carrier protein
MNQAAELCKRYFKDFVPTIVGQSMLEDFEDFSACVEIVMTDDSEPPWRFVIENGRLAAIGYDGPPPNCRFESDAETLAELITGKTSPTNAFLEMRVEVTGDLDKALHLSLAMEEFFHRYPYMP